MRPSSSLSWYLAIYPLSRALFNCLSMQISCIVWVSKNESKKSEQCCCSACWNWYSYLHSVSVSAYPILFQNDQPHSQHVCDMVINIWFLVLNPHLGPSACSHTCTYVYRKKFELDINQIIIMHMINVFSEYLYQYY